MNGHLKELLDAYLDGELNASQRRQAEAHLEGCPECRSELEQRRALSSILRADPMPAAGKSEQRFTAEVSMRMARKPAASRTANRTAAAVWMAVPVTLALAWAFVQAVSIVVDTVEVIPGAEEVLQNNLLASIPQVEMPQALRDGLQWFAMPGFGSWDDIALMMALIGIGVLLTGWFAGWWVSQRAAGSQR
jgi:predicted anti-sigma-YlaC factor YlaD